MKKLYCIVLFFLCVIKGYTQHTSSDTTGMANAVAQFKTDMIGAWYAEGHGAATHKQGAIFDTTLYNSLPFKKNDQIVFQKNGYYRINGSKKQKRFEVLNTASCFKFDGGRRWTFRVKLDGVEYFANFDSGYLSLGYDYKTGSWSQPLSKEVKARK